MSTDDGAVDKLPDQNEASAFYARYEAGDLLGKGLSSTVRRCVCKATGKQCAVKIVDKTQDQDCERVIRTEMQCLHDVCPHSHIIKLEDTFESSTFFFLVFELAENGELFDYLTQVVRCSEKKTRVIMMQLVEAVKHVHNVGYVHRDLKPENILLDEHFNVKLSDFGFATKYEGRKLRNVCGTPAYLAPEMLQCTVDFTAPGYDNKVDMWAIGVILYTMLAGFPPFWHRKQLLMLRAIMNGKFRFGSPEWDDISENAKDLITKLLTLNVAARLTAEEVLSHPWMSITQQQPERRFSARARFRVYIRAVLFCTIMKMRITEAPVNLQGLGSIPYKFKLVRQLIDGCAFRIYGHWVKRGDDQNRATLFEHQPKAKLVSGLDRPSQVLLRM
ncbi:phosphorylase b kinase gamma catalytic chain, liver/testis isoform-like [Corticium candelabrum]|uniref:phosphorylase b kinase gamma catalytic chain, liver/testis isoform-like n=1 Tax=Corticium candelabrum TaxID=121492 RepID=UPI002E256089|nr:phosphorylase b kinase gamma catalytic chain, liver/testis isoform-like [Corticium candelabrum]